MGNNIVWIRRCPDPVAWHLRLIPSIGLNSEDCWPWIYKCDAAGYGIFTYYTPSGRRRMTHAHRASWLTLRGRIGPDLVVDHLCSNPPCINPDHLEPVTNAENIRRAYERIRPIPLARPLSAYIEPVPLGTGQARVDEMLALASGRSFRRLSRAS